MFPRLLAGAARHREHHATGGPPYQQFFGFMDAAFSPPPTPAKMASGTPSGQFVEMC